MVSMTLYLDVPSREDVVKAIEGWEETVKWIAGGWDCEDEYWNDLSYREALDKVIDRYASLTPLSKKLCKRIERVDEKFRQVTVESRLCVWDTYAKIGALKGEVSMACDEYDSERYWYYYHWPHDAPDVYRKYDVYELQEHCCGLDFHNMEERELKRVASEFIDDMHDVVDRLQRKKPDGKECDEPSSTQRQ